MANACRAGHMDVSNTVDVSDARAVACEVRSILEALYPGSEFSAVDRLVHDFSRLYGGTYPGFRACDIQYHNAQHVLDVTLAMARLLDGHDRNNRRAEHLGPELALAGIASALFHDSGYIRRANDRRAASGAVYTRNHISRGARFMSDYLPTVDMRHLVGICTRIVQFTGYEVDPADIQVSDDNEGRLGALLGTADLIAQMADVDYVRKCHDHLYEEFVQGGMAGESGVFTHTGIIYRSRRHLLESTPGFMDSAIEKRLDGHFGSVHRYAADHFGGRHLYMDAIEANRGRLQSALANGGMFLP